MRIEVRLAPAAVPGSAAAVIVDVLRATTSLAVAWDAGAARIVPVATPAEAIAGRDRSPDALACGERGGLRVEGFDLGNSPAEYQASRVRGGTLWFASTNGSRAMLAAAGARRRLLAAFVNLAAVERRLAGERHVVVVCAGKDGRFALEDAACAGLLVARLAERSAATPLGAEAGLAHALAPRTESEVRALLEGCAHGRELSRLGPGFAADLARCAALDRLDAVPEL